MRPAAAFLLTSALALAACDQMRDQPKDKAFGESRLFADGMANQAPPAGVAAREDTGLPLRPVMTRALLDRGRARYEIACIMCHGAAGDGDGSVVARGFPRPPAFTDPRVAALGPGQVVDVITRGYGAMATQAEHVAPADRWAVAAYVQALRLSQAAPAGAMTPQDRARVEAGHG